MLAQPGELLCRQSAIDGLAELREFAPDRQWRLIQVAGSLAALDHNKAHLLGESCSSSCHLCTSAPAVNYYRSLNSTPLQVEQHVCCREGLLSGLALRCISRAMAHRWNADGSVMCIG
jgi:hypothetical protein